MEMPPVKLFGAVKTLVAFFCGMIELSVTAVFPRMAKPVPTLGVIVPDPVGASDPPVPTSKAPVLVPGVTAEKAGEEPAPQAPDVPSTWMQSVVAPAAPSICPTSVIIAVRELL